MRPQPKGNGAEVKQLIKAGQIRSTLFRHWCRPASQPERAPRRLRPPPLLLGRRGPLRRPRPQRALPRPRSVAGHRGPKLLNCCLPTSLSGQSRQLSRRRKVGPLQNTIRGSRQLARPHRLLEAFRPLLRPRLRVRPGAVLRPRGRLQSGLSLVGALRHLLLLLLDPFRSPVGLFQPLLHQMFLPAGLLVPSRRKPSEWIRMNFSCSIAP